MINFVTINSSSPLDCSFHEGKDVLCAQSCPTLCNPMDWSPPGSSIHGILQARILEWVVISSSRGSSQPRGRTHISCISCNGRQVLYHCATWEAHSPLPIHPSGLPLNLTPERFSDLPPKQIFSNLLISPCTQFTSVSQLHHKLWVHVPWFPLIEYLLVHASLCLPDSTISSGCVCHGFRVPYRICGDQAVPGTYTCLINI